MAHKFVIDTHALIWYLEGNPKLSQAAQVVMDDSASEMVLPMIAFAEAIYTVDKGRTDIASVDDLIADVLQEKRIELYPLTFEVLKESLNATTVPEMHDRLIVATALHLQGLGHQISVVTKDSDITASALVPLVW
jgi:PIN domain nuclease of toxin-antitoxin system